MTEFHHTSLQLSSEIATFLGQHVVDAQVAPCASAGFAQKSNGVWTLVGADVGQRIDRVYDLASISKTLTALLASRFVEQSQLAWHTRLDELLTETKGTWAGACSIEDLLSHRSGLIAHSELFVRSWQGQASFVTELVPHIAQLRGCQKKGDAVYSDLGYILAGYALEKVAQTALDWAIYRNICQPWGLHIASARSFLRVDPRFTERVAATEIQQGRGGLLRGMVHDDNAWALGGFSCCGHAGLFGDLASVLRLGCQLLEHSDAPLVSPLLRPREGGSLLMGLDQKSGSCSSAGTRSDPRTFGHLGFTGTSFWCDPKRQRVTVVLTNRVYPTRENTRLGPLRSKMHDFLWDC